MLKKWHAIGICIYGIAVTVLLIAFAPWELPDEAQGWVTLLAPAPIWNADYSAHGARVQWILLALLWFGLVGTPLMIYAVWRRECSLNGRSSD